MDLKRQLVHCIPFLYQGQEVSTLPVSPNKSIPFKIDSPVTLSAITGYAILVTNFPMLQIVFTALIFGWNTHPWWDAKEKRPAYEMLYLPVPDQL